MTALPLPVLQAELGGSPPRHLQPRTAGTRRSARRRLLALVVIAFAVALWSVTSEDRGTTVSLLSGSSLTVTLESSPDGTSSATDAIEVENGTFAAMSTAFSSLPDGSTATLPTTIEGLTGVTLSGVNVEARPDRATIALVGQSSAIFGQTYSPAIGVVVVVDWDELDVGDTNPRLLVSGQRSDGLLGDLLGVADGSLVADTPLQAGAVTVSNERDNPTPVVGETLLSPADFPAAAANYFEQIYGAPLPAAMPLRGSVNFQAAAEMGSVSPAVNAAFAFAPAELMVLEGSVATAVSDFPASGPDALNGLNLTGGTSARNLPAEVTELLSLDGAAPVGTFAIAASDNGTPGDPADDLLEPSWSAQVDLAAPLPAGSKTLRASISGFGADGVTVEFTTAIGDWAQPLGIDWASLDDVALSVALDGRRSEANDPQVHIDAALRGGTVVSGKSVIGVIRGSLDDPIEATLSIDLDDTITVRDYLTTVGATPHASVPAQVLDSNLGPATLTADVTTQPGPASVITVTVEGEFDFLPTPTSVTPLGASFLAQFVQGSPNDTTVAILPRGELRLSDLVPGVPTDLTLVSAESDLAFLMTTSPIVAPRADQIGGRVGDFLAPAYAGYPAAEVDIPAGFSVVGEIALPEDIGAFVSQSLGMRRSVHVRGVLPFGLIPSLDLELSLSLDPARTPDWIAAGDLTLSVSKGPTTLLFDITGSLTVKFRAGLPPSVAATLGDLGVDVFSDEPVAADYSGCRGGSQVMAQRTEAGLEHRCYDLLTFRVGASLKFSTLPAEVSAQLALTLDTDAMGVDFGWSPFGLEWLEVKQVALTASISYKKGPPPGIGLSIGISGSVNLGGTPLTLAAKVGQTITAKPPFVKVGLEGFRLSSDLGFSLTDFFPMQHQIARTASLVNELDPNLLPGPFTAANISIPDVQLRNIDLSFSAEQNTQLCIPQGLFVSADLYVDPKGDPAPRGDKCSPDGIPTTPPLGSTCGENADNGCVAGVRLALSKNGFKALAEINGFTLGPIIFDGAKLDIELTEANQHLILAGGVALDPIGGGELNVSLKRVGTGIEAQFAGKINVGPANAPLFTALADGKAAFDLDDFDSSGIELRIVLDASNLSLGALGQAFADQASAAIHQNAADVIAVLDQLSAAITAFRNDPAGFVNTGLATLGVDIPPEMQPLIDGLADLLAEGLTEAETQLLQGQLLRGALPGLPAAGMPRTYECPDITQHFFTDGKCYFPFGDPDPIGSPNPPFGKDACLNLRTFFEGRCYDVGGVPTQGSPPGGNDPILTCPAPQQMYEGKCYYNGETPAPLGRPNPGLPKNIFGGCGFLKPYGDLCYDFIPGYPGNPVGGFDPISVCPGVQHFFTDGKCYDPFGDPNPASPPTGVDPVCGLGLETFGNFCYFPFGSPDADGDPNGGALPVQVCPALSLYPFESGGRCYTVPPIEVPGLCQVFGLSQTCTIEDFIEGAVKPAVLRSADITASVFQSVADVLQAVDDAFALECASFQLVLNGQQQSVDVSITMRVGTESKTFTLGWDLSKTLLANLEGMLAGIEGAASTGCTPVDFGDFATEVFGTDGGELFHPVVVVADSFGVGEGRSITVDPLANDQNAKGASLTSVSISGGPGLTATIAEDRRRVVLTATSPMAAGQIASRVLSYQAVNASGQTTNGSAPVTVTGMNDPPVAGDDIARLDLRSATSVSISVLANDADPETGSALTVGSITQSSTGGCATATPVNTITLEALRCDGSASSYRALGEGQPVVDRFFYSAQDSLGAKGGAAVDVTVIGVNDAPTVTSVTASLRSLVLGDTLVLTGTFTDPDLPDAHALIVSWGDGTQSLHPVTPGSRTFRATHTYLTPGRHAVSAALTDGYATSTSQPVSATVRLPVSAAVCAGKAVTVDLNLAGGAMPTLGDDVIFGTPAGDAIDGLGGNDTICGGGGDDLIDGGPGHDTIDGGPGVDNVRGGDGDDMLTGGTEGDVMDGGLGEDTLLGGDGSDVLRGGPGNDELRGEGDGDVLLGDDGDDTVDGGAGADWVIGLSGNDSLLGGPENDIVIGGDGHDVLSGDGGDDLLIGGAGVDVLRGRRGNDVVFGGDGGDWLVGGPGDDTLLGEGDGDVVFGNDGNDTIRGGAGDDGLLGGPGDDQIFGDDGNDQLLGFVGDDALDGGPDTDVCNGGVGGEIFGDTSVNCETVIDVP